MATHRFPEPLKLQLLPRRDRWGEIAGLWSCGGLSRLLAVLSCLMLWRPERRRWVLLADFTFIDEKEKERLDALLEDLGLAELSEMADRTAVVVPAGTIINGLSIPWLFLRLISPMGKFLEASVIHDYLWSLIISGLVAGYSLDFRHPNRIFWLGCCAINAPPIMPACKTRVGRVAVGFLWRCLKGMSLIRPWAMWASVALSGRYQVWKLSRKR